MEHAMPVAELHLCKGRLPDAPDLAGPAFESCEEDDDGAFWCCNNEYGSQVAFCPYCGQKAPKQPCLP